MRSVAGAAKIQAAAPQPGPAAPAAAIATTAAAAPEPSLAAEFGTAMRKSTSTQSLPDQQRAKGTATNAKWARYDSTAPRGPRRLRAVHGGETLSAAVLSTGRLRLLVAALLALLLAAHWDAAAVASTAGSGAPPVAPGPLAEIATRVQGLLHQARQAAAPLLGSQTKPQAAEAAACQRCKQLLAPALGRVQGQVAAAAAQQPLTAWQRLRARALPAAAKAAHASCHLYGQARGQLAVLRAGDVSPAQAARAAAASLARHLHAQLAAAVASPLGQQALAVLDRMPPLAAVLLADLSLVGAAAAAMVAAPSLVHSTVSRGCVGVGGRPAGHAGACAAGTAALSMAPCPGVARCLATRLVLPSPPPHSWSWTCRPPAWSRGWPPGCPA